MENKKLTKGKKIAIISGCAAAGEALLGLAATVAVPFTGGATAPVAAALLSDSAKNTAISVGAAAGGAAVGAIGTKIYESKKNAKAYKDGYNDASKAYEAKFIVQAKEFAKKQKQWNKTEEKWKQTQKEKDNHLSQCMKYIKDLETEQDFLKKENKILSTEKQQLLKDLYGIRDNLCVV